MVTVVTGGGGVRLPVRREIAPLVVGLVRDLERARGKPFRSDWSWGYAHRAISGTSTPSNHSWGLAVDLDAPENPYLSRDLHRAAHSLRKSFPDGLILRSTMPDKVVTIAKHWGFGWGGRYPTKPDPMHFEFVGSVADADRLAGDSGIPKPPPPGKTPPPSRPTIKRGATGPFVRFLQRKLNINADGIFGSDTEKAVRRFQREKALAVDGVVGRQTWSALG
jgi:peptidoglycan hydrolase-like protein with peptidoglycan-binding domain